MRTCSCTGRRRRPVARSFARVQSFDEQPPGHQHLVQPEPTAAGPCFTRGAMSKPMQPRDPNVIDEAEDAGRLLERVAVGDRAAFHALYDRYAPRVMAVVRRNVYEPALAEDLVQDVFVAAWLSASRYRRDLGEPGVWLFGITRHKLIDHSRRMRRIAMALGVRRGAVQGAGEPDLDLRMTVEQALAELTVEQRRVVDLIYQAGLTFGEAARALQIPAGTVKSRVNAALSTMRAFFKGSVPSWEAAPGDLGVGRQALRKRSEPALQTRDLHAEAAGCRAQLFVGRRERIDPGLDARDLCAQGAVFLAQLLVRR